MLPELGDRVRMGLSDFHWVHRQQGFSGCVEGLQGKKSGDYIVASEALHCDIVGTCSVGLVVEDRGGRAGRQRDSIQELAG